jgi:putative ABC transport system permease protein
VFLIALRDLQFRLRRFLISVIAVSLVLTLTLVLAGVAASLDIEVDHTLDQLGITTWIVSTGASGPFFGAVPMTMDAVDKVRGLAGVDEAEPQAFVAYTVDNDGTPEQVNLLGVIPGKLGAPKPDHGRALAKPGDVVMAPSFGLDLGSPVVIGNKSFTVVGTLDDSTMLGGIPNVFLGIDDLQDVAFKGAPVITSIAVSGTPPATTSEFTAVSRADAHADLIRPLHSVKDTIFLLSILLWVVTGCIIGSVIYLSALERVRDFAVFKAIGVSTRWVLGGLVLQAVLLSIAASVAAIAIGSLLSPRMAVPVTLPLRIIVLVPVTAVAVSLLGSLAGVNRAVRVDPALAFG